MPARLVISTEEGVVLELRLGAEPVTLGRAQDNQVVANDRRTSRHHAIIRRTGPAAYEITDTGSSNGTFLNGQRITKEALAHLDLLNLAGLKVQFFQEPENDPEHETTGQFEVTEMREQVQRMIADDAELRRALGKTQDAEAAALRSRDEALEEVNRLREVVSALRTEVTESKARIESLGFELRNERAKVQREGGEVERDKERLSEAQRQVEKQRQRIQELEDRVEKQVLSEQTLRKEIEGFKDLDQKREKREQELTLVVKPALEQVHKLRGEVEKMRHALALANEEINTLRKGGGK